MNPSLPLVSLVRLPSPARGQRGVSLIVAMLMLGIIGLLSVGVIRHVTAAERMAGQRGMQAQALQYAQIALQFCERQLLLGDAAVVRPTSPPPDPPQWTVPANWYDAATVHTLNPSELPGAAPPAHPPECMLEATHAGWANVYTATSRGFSDDYAAGVDHSTVSGAVVWLQSTVQLGAARPGA